MRDQTASPSLKRSWEIEEQTSMVARGVEKKEGGLEDVVDATRNDYCATTMS